MPASFCSALWGSLPITRSQLFERRVLRWRNLNVTKQWEESYEETSKSCGSGSLLASVCAAPAIAEPAKVAIGYPPATDFLAVYVAKEKGFFAKHNIDATPTKFPVVTNIPSAIVSGSIQIGMTTIPVLLQAVDGGLDFVLIAGAAHHTKGIRLSACWREKTSRSKSPPISSARKSACRASTA